MSTADFDCIVVSIEATEEGQGTFLEMSDKIPLLETSIRNEISTVFITRMARNMTLNARTEDRTISLGIECLSSQIEWFHPYLQKLLQEK